MASTFAGRQLTEQHRQRQLAVRAVVVRQLVALWPLFDPARIDETWEAIAPAVMTLTAQGRSLSAAVASAYYQAFRLVEGVTGETAMPVLSDDWRVPAAVSLQVTGPIKAKQLTMMGRRDVAAQTLVSLSGSVSRIALNAGRETVLGAVREDRRAIGWARVTDGDPCAFCALLAGRGGVYSKDSVDFQAHDHCACGSEPVYRRDAPLPGRGDEFRRLYQESTAGAESGELLNAFRRAYEDR